MGTNLKSMNAWIPSIARSLGIRSRARKPSSSNDRPGIQNPTGARMSSETAYRPEMTSPHPNLDLLEVRRSPPQ